MLVDHDVNCATNAVTGQMRKLLRFADDTLTGERGITVDQDADDLLAGRDRRMPARTWQPEMAG